MTQQQQGGLHLKYRPQNLSEVYGNEFLVESVQSFLRRKPENQPRAYLLHGPSGTGKTTIARIMAKEMGAAGMDLVEINSADYRGIETVRNLIKRIALKPMESKIRAYILDEAHQFSKDAMEGLNKPLEDTPEHVRFFICTTDPQKLLLTNRNRCTQIAVNPLDDRDMGQLIAGVVLKEDKKISRSALNKIVEVAQGSPRMALTVLDRVIDLPRSEQADAVEGLGENTAEIIDLCRALMQNREWQAIVKALKDGGAEPEDLRRAVLGYCTTAMLGGDSQAYLVMDAFREPTYSTGWAGICLSCYDAQEG